MRRRLVIVFIAVSTSVTLAFLIPLAVLVRSTTEDRALDRARSDAAALSPVLATTQSRSDIEVAMQATASGALGRITIFMSDGNIFGNLGPASALVATALAERRSLVGDSDGGAEVVSVVALSESETVAVRVLVPSAELRQGQYQVWAILAVVGITLVAVAVVIADQLARTIVRPSETLALAASRLGDGDLEVFVDPGGPEELQRIAKAFNVLAVRLSDMLRQEREMVAELSHRLRTPLTKLRIDADRIQDPEVAAELQADIDAVTNTLNSLIIEARESAARRQPQSCDAQQVARDRIGFWSPLADEEGREWSLDEDGEAAIVPIASEELAATIDALIENVFSHTEEGVGFGLLLRRLPGEVSITVVDDGDGVTADLVEKGRSGAGSTGLGLGIADRTATAAGGSFTVSRGSSGGASFELRLPLVIPGRKLQ